MKQKTNEFMTMIFSDLHKDKKFPNVYMNNKSEWMFELDLELNRIYVNYGRVWLYFEKNIATNYNIIKMLIEGWLKENIDWPQLQPYWLL